MLRLIWIASIHIRYFLRRYAPTNILLDAIRARRGLKWGIPAMLLAAPYLYAAAICTTIIDQGGPGWLNILTVLFIWDAFKMLWIGPISLVLLVRVRIQERRGDGLTTRDVRDIGVSDLPTTLEANSLVHPR